jgi:NADP-dependent 3-hydroxy acid dehydrogenase YdfG
MSKVYFITGTSSGFGRALAEAALERGEQVVLAARKIADIENLAAQYEDKALALKLDVTNADERQAAVSAALDKFGRIDVLANIAGVGSLGALEEFSSEQIRQQFEVNLFGVLEMTRTVLPVMREQRSGHILNLTSIGAAAPAVKGRCASRVVVR